MIKHMSGTRWLDGREVGMTLCAICTVHKEARARISWFSPKTKVYGFSWFDLKTVGYSSCGLASKPLARVFWFEPQNRQLRFGDLAHKITTTVFSLCLKIKWAMVYRLRHKTDGKMKMARDTH
jgi:hypothetical protein